MRSPLAFLRELTGTRESEAIRLFLMASYLLLIISCYTATKAVRDSLFIIEIGPSQLPYLYVLTAVTMALISAVYPAALRKMGLFALVRLTSFVAIASLMAFWWLVAYGGRVSFYVLYLWVSLFGAITASQAWSLASHVLNAREARRSFAWIGAGGVIGGIVGGTLASFLAPRAGTEALLPLCAVLMLLTVVISYRLDHWRERSINEEIRSEPDYQDASGPAVLRRIKDSPYLPMLVLLLLTGVVVEAFVDYEFKVIASSAFDSRDRLTSFFGAIASYGGILALILQTLITPRLLKRFGVGVATLLLPTALLAGSLLVAAYPVLWAVSILKLLDGSLSYSVHRSGMELLYIPIPAGIRASVKAFIDLLVDRGGRALGGLFLLLLTAGWSFSVPALSVVASVCLIVWLGVALLVRRRYVHAFRVALEKKVIEPEALEVRTLDNTILQALVQALTSPDARQVLYALDLLKGVHPMHWHRYLPSLLEHTSPAVRTRTIALLTERKVSSPALVSARLADPVLDVRVEAVRYLCEVVTPEPGTRLRELLAHEDYGVVLAALQAMAKYRMANPGLIDERLIERASSTTGEFGVSARTGAACALALVGLRGKTQCLERLLRDPSIEVIQEAIRTAAELRYQPAIPLLISMLARAPLRRAAREALLKLGPEALLELQSRLRDERTPMEIRSRIPKVLSFTGKQEIADFLLESIHGTRTLDMPLLKALNRMQSLSAEIKFENERVCALVEDECARHRQLAMIRQTIRPADDAADGGKEPGELLSLLCKAIGERLSEGLERTFRLLALIHSQTDIRLVYFNLSFRPALRANAIEFLDNLIEPRLSALVLPLLDEGMGPEASEDRRLSREAALQLLVEGDDGWLQAIARELAGKGGFDGVLFSRTA